MVLENRPPVWNAAPVVSAPFGASLIVNLLGYASDPENDVITFTSIGTPLPAGWSIVGTELRYSGGGAIATTNNIRLRATASGGSADSALFSITVYSLPPSWSAAPAPPSVVIGTASSYSLLPLVSDPENDPITFTSIGTALPTGWSINNTTKALDYNGAGTAASTAGIRLRASSNGGTADSAIFSVTIVAASPLWTPTIPTQNLVVGVPYSLDLDTVCDPDTSTYSIVSGSIPGMTLSGSVYSGTPTAAGTTPVTFRADDGQSSSALADWLARSTGAGVVWAHNFDTVTEVNNFRWQGGIGNVPVLANSDGNTRWVSNDGFAGGGCLELNIPSGGVCSSGWQRPFSPLLGTGNGRGVDDPGNGGTITRRAWNPNNPGQAEAWQNGFYAAAANFASQGGAAAFDGSDFYIQFRVKQSANRANGGNPPGKLAFLGRTQYTPNNEIVIQSNSGLRYSMYTNFGARSNSSLYEPQDGGSGPYSSLQPGSQFASPPTYWNWPLDEWVTVLIRVVCGRHTAGDAPNVATGFKETGITVWVARAGATTYTKIWDKADYVITYGSGSDRLPWGWNAFIPSGYMNGVAAAAGAGWTQRFTQIVFSRSNIPCPQV